jgi:hypothetical protein
VIIKNESAVASHMFGGSRRNRLLSRRREYSNSKSHKLPVIPDLQLLALRTKDEIGFGAILR